MTKKLVDPAEAKWEEVAPTLLRPGDRIVLYGLEVGVITKADPFEAHIEYEHKGKTYVGLPPRKTKEGVTRIVEK